MSPNVREYIFVGAVGISRIRGAVFNIWHVGRVVRELQLRLRGGGVMTVVVVVSPRMCALFG